MSEDSDDYRVGPGKPPRHTRFKPGQSGNPNGRPKRRDTFQYALERELMRIVVVPENGKRRRVQKQQLVAQTVVHRAIKGDHKAAELVFRTSGSGKEAASAPGADLPVADPEMLKRIQARLNRLLPEE